MNPLVERRCRVTVSVQRPGGAASDSPRRLEYAFEDHRMHISISQGGGQFGNARIAIFGMRLDAMNKIARLWLESMTPITTDTVGVDVWDGGNFVPLFRGVIAWAAVNAGSAPDVSLEIDANSFMAAMNEPAPPYVQDTPLALQDALTAILAPTDITVAFAETVPALQVQKVHVIGTPMQQAQRVMNAYPELTWYIDLQRMIVRPVGAPAEETAVTISRETGLIGYPTYSTSGVTLSTLFDPRIRLGLALDIRTEFDFVNRTKWITSVLQHNLQPNMPGGQWSTQIAAQAWGKKGNTNG